jgi:hypothetical protein
MAASLLYALLRCFAETERQQDTKTNRLNRTTYRRWNTERRDDDETRRRGRLPNLLARYSRSLRRQTHAMSNTGISIERGSREQRAKKFIHFWKRLDPFFIFVSLLYLLVNVPFEDGLLVPATSSSDAVSISIRRCRRGGCECSGYDTAAGYLPATRNQSTRNLNVAAAAREPTETAATTCRSGLGGRLFGIIGSLESRSASLFLRANREETEAEIIDRRRGNAQQDHGRGGNWY